MALAEPFGGGLFNTNICFGLVALIAHRLGNVRSAAARMACMHGRAACLAVCCIRLFCASAAPSLVLQVNMQRVPFIKDVSFYLLGCLIIVAVVADEKARPAASQPAPPDARSSRLMAPRSLTAPLTA